MVNDSKSKIESDPRETAEEFMSRWSRRKQQARAEEQLPQPIEPKVADSDKAPVLPNVEDLGMDSDYRDFFHPKVKETVRRAALKKLFSDPHFSVVDGMDIYMDDYSIAEELPAAMAAGLKQTQNILGWAKEDREAEAERERVAANLAAEQQPGITDAPAATTDPATSAPESGDVVVQQDSTDAGTQNT
ncbi:MAG: DUF3306 domain-containing protein [Betaproteobacteria bacterium]|jgi:hypothetical protein|nr:DUF3306 domain-containing protein [Betaproteobacteria bacterium]MDH5342678.1 DUF3306 domain-containing protein [Betaproteobacteria bacterium]